MVPSPKTQLYSVIGLADFELLPSKLTGSLCTAVEGALMTAMGGMDAIRSSRIRIVTLVWLLSPLVSVTFNVTLNSPGAV